MSKEITYLNANLWVGYLAELAELARAHKDALAKRGLKDEVPAQLDAVSEELQAAILEHLQSQMTTNREGEETQIARARLNEWMGLIKHAARLHFRNDPKYVLVKHDLRIGVPYQTRRTANVLSEAQAMLPGVKKYAAALKTRLTEEELAEGEALVAELAASQFGRLGSLSEQLTKRFDRDALIERGRALAQQVLDAADLAFQSGEPQRELFFELDERLAPPMGTPAKPEPTPA